MKNGGAIYFECYEYQNCTLMINDKSIFNRNVALYGGAIHSYSTYLNVFGYLLDRNIKFNENHAKYVGNDVFSHPYNMILTDSKSY